MDRPSLERLTSRNNSLMSSPRGKGKISCALSVGFAAFKILKSMNPENFYFQKSVLSREHFSSFFSKTALP